MRDLESMRNQFDRFFSDLPVSDGAPPIDVQETDDSIIVRASMPGYKPEDLTVTFNRGTLSIRGESHEEHDETKGKWHVRERRSGSVYRTVTLPAEAVEEKANATLKDGVLEIRFPKTTESVGHEISVKSA